MIAVLSQTIAESQTMEPKKLHVLDGLALERALLSAVISGAIKAGVRIWCVADRALVVPRRLAGSTLLGHSRLLCEGVGYPVIVRDSGGGPVPLAPGVMSIAISFIVPHHPRQYFGIESAYDALCAPLVRWLQDLELGPSIGPVAGAFCDGRFNITLGGCKVVGTAQRWRNIRDGQQAVLAHAALFVDSDVNELVHVTNTFYRLSGIDQHCEERSHTTLHTALAKAGHTPIDWRLEVTRLQTLYGEALTGLHDNYNRLI